MNTINPTKQPARTDPAIRALFDVLEVLHIADQRPDAEIASELGITTNRLRHWFSNPGELTFDNLFALSSGLGLDDVELLDLWGERLNDQREIAEQLNA